ncbi:MAG: GNAT family N-acetyltransferase, partial [Mailhella sp.]|nr:GNAT family N-acetyltransferase [Mailhella sp.]
MIEHVRKDDIPDCVRVITESFLTVAKDFSLTPENSPGFTGFATTEEKLLNQLDIEQRPMFIFRENGVIVGYYSLQKKHDHDCELSNLSVLPAHRHNGIGKKLLAHAFAT